MPGKALKTFAHVDQRMDLFVRLIKLTKLRIDLQRPVYGNIQFIGNHLGKIIHISIRQIHHPAYVPDHALGSKGTESYNLYYLFRPILPAHIINHLLPSFKAEVYIDIRHGNTLRVQKTLKQKIIFDGINIGNLQRIRNNTPGR